MGDAAAAFLGGALGLGALAGVAAAAAVFPLAFPLAFAFDGVSPLFWRFAKLAIKASLMSFLDVAFFAGDLAEVFLAGLAARAFVDFLETDLGAFGLLAFLDVARTPALLEVFFTDFLADFFLAVLTRPDFAALAIISPQKRFRMALSN